MRILRALGGALLWVVASVVCLLALVLCVTVVLLPLGIPLFMLGRKLFGVAIRMFLPRGVLHPAKTSGEATKSAARKVRDGVGEQLSSVSMPDKKSAGKKLKKTKKKLRKVAHA